MGPAEKLGVGAKFSNCSPSLSPGPVQAAQVAPRERAERCREYRPHRAPLPAPPRRPGPASGARGEVSGSSLDGRAGDRRLHALPGATQPGQQRTPSNQRKAPTGGQPGACRNPTGGSGRAPSSYERRRVGLIPLPGSQLTAQGTGPARPPAQPHLARPPLSGASKVRGAKRSQRRRAGPGPSKTRARRAPGGASDPARSLWAGGRRRRKRGAEHPPAPRPPGSRDHAPTRPPTAPPTGSPFPQATPPNPAPDHAPSPLLPPASRPQAGLPQAPSSARLPPIVPTPPPVPALAAPTILPTIPTSTLFSISVSPSPPQSLWPCYISPYSSSACPQLHTHTHSLLPPYQPPLSNTDLVSSSHPAPEGKCLPTAYQI